MEICQGRVLRKQAFEKLFNFFTSFWKSYSSHGPSRVSEKRYFEAKSIRI
jgi:hypothetical protein